MVVFVYVRHNKRAGVSICVTCLARLNQRKYYIISNRCVCLILRVYAIIIIRFIKDKLAGKGMTYADNSAAN